MWENVNTKRNTPNSYLNLMGLIHCLPRGQGVGTPNQTRDQVVVCSKVHGDADPSY